MGFGTDTETISIEVDSIRFEIEADEAFRNVEARSSYRLLSLPGASNIPVPSTFTGTPEERLVRFPGQWRPKR